MHSWVFRHHRRLEAIYLRAAPGHVRALPQPEGPDTGAGARAGARGDELRVLVLVPERRRDLHAAGG